MGLLLVLALDLDIEPLLKSYGITITAERQLPAGHFVDTEVFLIDVHERDHAVLKDDRCPLLLGTTCLAVSRDESVLVAREKLALSSTCAQVDGPSPSDTSRHPDLRDLCGCPVQDAPAILEFLEWVNCDAVTCRVEGDTVGRHIGWVEDKCRASDFCGLIWEDPLGTFI